MKTPGQRNTQQRTLILSKLQSMAQPLTIHELHESLLEDLPTLGIATVYRTVKLLLDAGLVISVNLPDNHTRYEIADTDHHHHFHCTECNRVFCLDYCPVSLPKDTVLPQGFLVKDHAVTLYGACADCRESA